MRTIHSQKGVALISVLLVFAIVATLAATLLSRSQADIERTSWLIAEAQAQQYALGGEALARQILWEENKRLATDGLNITPVPQTLPVYEPDHGKMAIEIIDLQGLINLNNINDKPEMQLALKNLFDVALLKPQVVNTLADWVDDDTMPRSGGAEDSSYLSLPQPYRAANAPLASRSELLAINQFDPAEFSAIENHVSALPSPTPININTASADVLSLINPGLSGQQVVHEREQLPNGFQSVSDFLASNAAAGLEIPGELLTVTSSYYGVRILATFNDRTFRLFSRLHLDSNSGKITLYDRTLGDNFTINTLKTDTTNQDDETAQPLL